MDLISRQAAIDAVKCGALSAAMVYGRTDEGSTALYETVKAIKALPSAQPEPIKINIEDFNKEDWERLKKEWGNTPITVLPAQPERKRGKWVWLSSTYDRIPCEMRYMCSECHHETILHSNESSDPWEKYCPNCGADMRGDSDE